VRRLIAKEGGCGGAKKRPSVETEGRLTIACHMKNLQKIDVVVRVAVIFTFLHLHFFSLSEHEDSQRKTL
jgi:hypothetical protein